MIDIFAIQSEIALQIVHALKAELTPEEQQQIETKPTENSEAYSHYLRAMGIAGLERSTVPVPRA